MGYLRRQIRDKHLLPACMAKLVEAGVEITKGMKVLESSLKGIFTCTMPISCFATPEALQAWILAMVPSNLLSPANVIWVETPSDKQKGGHVVLCFTSAFLVNEADNGKQAHSGHRAIAQRWVVNSEGKDIQVLATGGNVEVPASVVARAQQVVPAPVVPTPDSPEVQEAGTALLASQPLTGASRGSRNRTRSRS